MITALTRAVSPAIGQCELTHLARQPINVALAQAQHHAYEAALHSLGARVQQLPPTPHLPDAVFVEDTAVVLDEVAIITRPGAISRRPETASVAAALAAYRPLIHLQAPATLDGGDVLRMGRRLYIGSSGRSNQAAIEQLRAALAPYGYHVVGVPVSGCLHLKSAVTLAAPDTLLINRQWVDSHLFGPLRLVPVAEAEPYAGNGLLLGETLIYPAGYPQTAQRLAAAGIPLQLVEVTELVKAEGAVTCCSLLITGP